MRSVGSAARCLMTMLLVFACASSAEAAKKSFWGWLDELSGPGPFTPDNLGTVTFTALTRSTDREHQLKLFEVDPARRKWFVVGELGSWKAEPKKGFLRPSLFTAHGLAYFPLSGLLSSPVVAGLDAGAGLGVYRLREDEAGGRVKSSFSAAIPLRLRITPARWAGNQKSTVVRRLSGVTYAVGGDLLLDGFSPGDFTAPAGYRPTRDFLWRVGFQVDLNQVLWPGH